MNTVNARLPERAAQDEIEPVREVTLVFTLQDAQGRQHQARMQATLPADQLQATLEPTRAAFVRLYAEMGLTLVGMSARTEKSYRMTEACLPRPLLRLIQGGKGAAKVMLALGVWLALELSEQEQLMAACLNTIGAQ